MELPREGHLPQGPQGRQHDNSSYYEDGTPVHSPRLLFPPGFQGANGRPSPVQQQHHQPPDGWKPMPQPSSYDGENEKGHGPGKGGPVPAGTIGLFKPRRWRLLRHFPWLTLLAMILSIVCKCPSRLPSLHTGHCHNIQILIPPPGTFLAATIAWKADDCEVDKWSFGVIKTPSVILSLTSTIANTLITYAFANAGTVIFWLLLMKPGGVPITDLHYFSQGATSFKGALKSLGKRRSIMISIGKLISFFSLTHTSTWDGRCSEDFVILHQSKRIVSPIGQGHIRKPYLTQYSYHLGRCQQYCPRHSDAKGAVHPDNRNDTSGDDGPLHQAIAYRRLGRHID